MFFYCQYSKDKIKKKDKTDMYENPVSYLSPWCKHKDTAA